VPSDSIIGVRSLKFAMWDWFGNGPLLDSADVVVCEKGEIEVWSPLLSSSEGLQIPGLRESAEREWSRTIPSSAACWLVSETSSVRSR
jgi:hypothetical protein